MIRTLLILFAVITSFSPITAMIIELPLEDLINSSEYIVVAKVESNELLTASENNPETSVTYSIEKTLKGTHKQGEKFSLSIPGSSKIRFQDNATIQKEGEKALLFLKTGANGSLVINNNVQGLWPIDSKTEETLGMGLSYSIEQVVDYISENADS